MNKKILSEIDIMKYLLDYKRGVVISEQKIILNESGKICQAILDSVSLFRGKIIGITLDSKEFVTAVKNTVKSYDNLQKVNKCLEDNGYKSLESLVNFVVHDTKDEKYWLGELDKHFKNYEMNTNFSGKKQGTVAAPKVPKAPTPTIVSNKDGWENVYKYYKITPKRVKEDDKIYEYIVIEDGGKKYILYGYGDVYSVTPRSYLDAWEWVNNKPNLNLPKVTNQASGYATGDDCDDEFCNNNKILGPGSRGKCVKDVQYYLLNSGLVDEIQLTKDLEGCKNSREDCDGIYGRETEKAVRMFQKKSQIRVDGRVGCQTYDYLY